MALAPDLDLSGPIQQAIASPNIAAILEQRIAQIERHGHDPRADAARPPDHLPRLALDYVQGALDHIRRGASRDGEIARSRLVKAAALCLAAADRLGLDRMGNSIEAEEAARDLFEQGDGA